MMTPNPRSLGDSYPDDPRSLETSNEGDADSGNSDEARKASRSAAEAVQDFQDPMTEEDVASGGPADRPQE
ncbi:hypothetical protein [Leucobacter japonicus]|uniref:hypothetical protein n=1 Tax=Leucobacter japonicus TaxID=1461259 RepID=UPI0012E1924E|nr:hypothetical protein [Leucobacter japonicus]